MQISDCFVIYVHPQVYVVLAIGLLMIPLDWLCAWLTAFLLHEMGHCLAVMICGGKIRGIALGLNGAEIQADPLSEGKNMICTLAGPIVGAIPLLFSVWMPRISICAFLLSSYNLLPIFSLDGASAFRSLTGIIFSQITAHRICKTVELLCLALIIGILLYLCFCCGQEYLPLMIFLVFVIRHKKTKIPCKAALDAVQ